MATNQATPQNTWALQAGWPNISASKGRDQQHRKGSNPHNTDDPHVAYVSGIAWSPTNTMNTFQVNSEQPQLTQDSTPPSVVSQLSWKSWNSPDDNQYTSHTRQPKSIKFDLTNNDNDNDHSYSQLPATKRWLAPRARVLGLWPSLFGEEKNSLYARQIKQCVPLRSLAAWSWMGLHLCKEGVAFHSRWVCREKSWLLRFGRVSLL